MKREFACGMLVLSLFAACLSQQAKESIADSTYASEQLKCVDDYPTREQIDACRRNVRLRWGISETVTDGGRDGR